MLTTFASCISSDISSLNLPPIEPDGKRLDVDLSSPLFCQRPDSYSSLDEKTKIIQLYENIVYRDDKNPLYQQKDDVL